MKRKHSIVIDSINVVIIVAHAQWKEKKQRLEIKKHREQKTHIYRCFFLYR